MAITLVEMAKGMKDKVTAGLLLDFARQSTVMEMVKFENTDSFIMNTAGISIAIEPSSMNIRSQFVVWGTAMRTHFFTSGR